MIWRLGKIGCERLVKLPYDFEVEYLESTGTQWIDTGILADENTSIKATLKTISTGNKNWFGGSVSGSASYASGFCFNSYSNSQIEYFFGRSGWKVVSIPDIVGRVFDLEFGKNAVVIDGSTISTPSHYTFDEQTKTITIFVRNGGTGYIDGQLYSFQIYQNNILVRDMTPVRFTNELGQSEGAMYDRVSGKLFRNKGTGSFIYGPDKIPVETDRYVQDCLVAMWDGKENAGVGLHDANATVWKDLVGGGLSQFSATPSWAQNGLSIVPSNNTITFNSPDALLALASSGFSIEIVAYMQALATTRFYYIVDSTTSSNTIGIFTHSSSAMFILQKLGSLANVVAYGNNMTFPDSASCATVYDSGLSVNNSQFYQNGEYSMRRTNTSTLSPSALYAIMRDNGPTGIYHSLRIYSRALTAAEIAANYAVDKARFGI